MSYAEVFEAFPSELRLPIARLVDALKAEFEVPRADFADLKAAMQSLAEAQARTETRVGELATAQTRTEARIGQASRSSRDTCPGAGAHAGGSDPVSSDFYVSDWWSWRPLGPANGRSVSAWYTTILGEVGFTAERFLTWDAAGEVFGHPEQVELDIVIQNGKAIVVEIKSSLDRANIYFFNRKVEFYTRHTGRQVDRKVVIASYADERAKEVAMRLGIEVCTDVTEFR